MQRRRILFLISLPPTQEFERDRKEIEECLLELQARDVTVRRDVSETCLSDAALFDAVILVAHYDVKRCELVLHDDVLPLDTFAGFLPSGFTGIMDLSVCHSSDIVSAVKARCPGCKVQAALSSVPLLERIIIYPNVADLFLSQGSMSYAEAYDKVSNMFRDMLSEQGADDVASPRMTPLGESVSTVFAPEVVARNDTFLIVLFFSYDADNQTFCFMQTDGEMRDTRVTNVVLEEDDVIDVFLSFFTPGRDAIEIVDDEGSVRSFRVGKGTTTTSFVVNVTEDFEYGSFVSQVVLSCRGEMLAKLRFNIEVSSKASRVPAKVRCADSLSEDAGAIQDVYGKIADKRLLDIQDSDRLNEIRCRKMSDERVLHDLRSYMLLHELCYPSVMRAVEAAFNNLDKCQDGFGRDVDIRRELLYSLRYNLRLCADKMEKMKKAFDAKLLRCKGVHEHMMASFPAMERRYLDVLLRTKDIILQVELLGDLQNLKGVLDDDQASRSRIKEQAAAIARRIQEDGTDRVLYGYVHDLCRKTLYANRSGGITKPALALFISMLKGGGPFLDTGRRCMTEAFERYMDVGDKNGVREVYNILKNLKDRTLGEKLDLYRRTRCGSISVSAYFIQKIIITST